MVNSWIAVIYNLVSVLTKSMPLLELEKYLQREPHTHIHSFKNNEKQSYQKQYQNQHIAQ